MSMASIEKELKALADAKAEVVVDFCTGFQARVDELMSDQAELSRLIRLGADRARAAATPTLAAVYDRVGFAPLPAP